MASPVALQFTPNKVLLGLGLSFLPILLTLGCWQLHRASEKEDILAFRAAQLALPPVDWTVFSMTAPREPMTAAFRRLKVEGAYDDSRYWLLENQVWQGQVGYRVIAPFYTENSGLLIDRGWVPGTAYRDELPEVPTPTGQHSLFGTVATFSDHRLLENRQQAGAWPRRILEVKAEELLHQLESTVPNVRPVVLRLDISHPTAFTVLPQSVNMPPRKHIGYAVQWFALAFALTVLSVFANTNFAEWKRSRQLKS